MLTLHSRNVLSRQISLASRPLPRDFELRRPQVTILSRQVHRYVKLLFDMHGLVLTISIPIKTRYRIKPADRRKTSHRTLMMNEVDGLEYIISPSISPGQWFIFRCGCKNHPFVRDPLESGFGLRRHLKSKPHQNFHDHLDYDMSDEDLILKYGYEGMSGC